MKIKKIISIALVSALLATSFTACSSTSEPSSSSDAIFLSDYYTDDGYFAGIKASDYVDLSDLSLIEMPAEYLEVTEEEIAEYLAYMTENALSSTPKLDLDYVIQDGDTVNIDYVGSIDGVPFDGGSTMGEGTDVTIGVTQYIDGFLVQLIGTKATDEYDINVTFPDDYYSEDLAGKDAVFSIVNNYVVEKEEITDEFISELTQGAHDTLDSYIEGYKEYTIALRTSNYISTALLDYCIVDEIPAELTDFNLQVMHDSVELSAAQYGLTAEQLLSENGYTSFEEYVEAQSAMIELSLSFQLIVQAIAEQNGIVATEADVEAFFVENFNTTDYSSYEASEGLNSLKSVALEDIVIKYVTELSIK